MWRSQHGWFDHHGRFDERTLCTSSARNNRLLYSASSCGIWRSQHGHFIFNAFSNNGESNAGVGVDHHHATNDFCKAPRLAESGAHSMDGLITMDGLMKEPCAQLQHATNDFCIAPRLAESGTHSMESSFSRHFPIIARPQGCGSGSSARNKRLLYSASSCGYSTSSCGIWRSHHGGFDHHGRFDERT